MQVCSHGLLADSRTSGAAEKAVWVVQRPTAIRKCFSLPVAMVCLLPRVPEGDCILGVGMGECPGSELLSYQQVSQDEVNVNVMGTFACVAVPVKSGDLQFVFWESELYLTRTSGSGSGADKTPLSPPQKQERDEATRSMPSAFGFPPDDLRELNQQQFWHLVQRQSAASL